MDKNIWDIKHYCQYCKEELIVKGILDFKKFYYGLMANGKKRLFCNEEHYKLYWDQFLVEEYKQNKIYKVIGDLYIPYIGCHYAFKTLQDCRDRIDNKNCSVVNTCEFAWFMNQMK